MQSNVAEILGCKTDLNRLALGSYGLLELEYCSSLLELLRHYHPYLLLLVIFADHHQEFGIQGSTRSASHCTSKRRSVPKRASCHMALGQVPYARTFHAGWLNHSHWWIHHAYLHQPSHDSVWWNFSSCCRHLSLQSSRHGMASQQPGSSFCSRNRVRGSNHDCELCRFYRHVHLPFEGCVSSLTFCSTSKH